MAKLELLWNVELPLFKILFNNDLFSAIEVKKLDDFLLEIWLNDEDLSKYKELQQIDTSGIDRDRVNSYQNNIIDLFANKKEFIKSTISKTEVFKSLTSNLRKKISVDNEKNLEIIYIYIRFGLLSLVTNYETQRVAKWIFDIVKK